MICIFFLFWVLKNETKLALTLFKEHLGLLTFQEEALAYFCLSSFKIEYPTFILGNTIKLIIDCVIVPVQFL